MRDLGRGAAACGQLDERQALAAPAPVGIALAAPRMFQPNGAQEAIVTRTFGAAIGALIFVFFMSYMAERLTTVQASSPAPQAASQR